MTCFMKKVVIGIVTFLIVVGGTYWMFSKEGPYDAAYAIPEGFKGCVYIVYNVEDAPPLEVKDNTIQYKLDEDGIMLTSSPEDFGWEGERRSGFYNSDYFYVDENGNKTEDIPQEMIIGEVLGESTQVGKTITRKTFSVGNENAQCDTNYDDLLNKLEKKSK